MTLFVQFLAYHPENQLCHLSLITQYCQSSTVNLTLRKVIFTRGIAKLVRLRHAIFLVVGDFAIN